MPICRSTSRAKSASTSAGGLLCSRSVPARSRNASSIESGSTSGVSACIMARTSRPTRTYFSMSGRDDDRLGAGLQRLEHRHGRAHALDAGDVAGGRDDAALAAADDHRLVLQLRIVALLDRRIEGVAVDMGEMQLAELGMVEQPRAAAGLAARRLPALHRQAVAAKTVGEIVDSSAHRCEHKENRANRIVAARRWQSHRLKRSCDDT